ncbi:histidine phosphatase family protein [Piscibacillus halophilus]|uniref:Probable phosphoglycerate mutase n=1 Tax=Piscibacillus halophilus TaxID=571933 RepID=A0A1H9DNE2_9BACI|nr:histidine phosphatase family protein [Piscibacillus halophilus]SEQ15004.1 probable phosphoglycerate mutase [Piscibacillus halophilus]
MTVIGIVRHGITDWNLAKRAQGSSDIPLNEKGIQDAEKLANRLKDEKWGVLYSSDLRRAHQTAEIIATELEIPVITDERIREAYGGKIEGTTKAERIERWGENWFEKDLGIESNQSVVRRGMEFLNEVSEKHPDEPVLIVSHGSFIRQLLNELVVELEKKYHLGNTSITKLRRHESHWELELFNCTKHLNE